MVDRKSIILPTFSDLLKQGKIKRPKTIDIDYVENKWDEMLKPQTYHFTQLPLERRKWNKKLERSRDLRKALKDDVTDDLRDELYQIRYNKLNFVCGVHGDTGRGKSSLFLAMAEYLKPVVNPAFIGFNPAMMLRLLENCDVGTVAGLDENPDIYGAGTGYMRGRLSSVLDIARAHRLSFFRVCPSISSALPSQHYSILVYDRDMNKMVTRAFVFDNKLYPIGMALFPMPAAQTWEAYETAKMQNIDDTLANKDKTGVDDLINELEERIVNHEMFEVAETKGDVRAILSKVGGTKIPKVVCDIIIDNIMLSKKHKKLYGY